MNRKSCLGIILLVVIGFLSFTSTAQAQTPVVRDEDLNKSAILEFHSPLDLIGVPTLIVGEEVVVEKLEIPFLDKFSQDPLGNTIAVIILIGMIICLVCVGIGFVTGRNYAMFTLPNWLIPLLAFIGLGVASYLTFLDITKTPGVCGPIGNCNSVQESPYAYLFGIIPVGILGALGYIFLLVAWFLKQFGPSKWGKFLAFCIWVFALFGTLFSIYLTFLEPFVIGATCIWCLSSAIIMTMILLTSTGPIITYSTLNVSDEKSNENSEEFEQFVS